MNTSILLENGEIYSWGDGKYGKLGLGSVESKWEPTLVPYNEERSKKIFLSCGSNHTIVLKGIFNLPEHFKNKLFSNR